MKNYSADWFSGNIPNWEKFLAEMKGMPSLFFLEIGCFEGMATLWLLENILTAETSKIMVIDPFSQTENYAKLAPDLCSHHYREMFDENTKDYSEKIIVNPSPSYPALIRMALDYQNTFDFVYVDGDHTSKGCLNDMTLSWELLKKNGIMIIDDYEWIILPNTLQNPKIGVDAFLSVYKDEYDVVSMGYQVVLRKKI